MITVRKEAFVVIGKEGSTMDGEGFIQKLWDDANSHFAEVSHLAKRDENGNLVGVWGAMSDFSRSFKPWEEDFSKGLYLAGVECGHDAEAPEGWIKWTIPFLIVGKNLLWTVQFVNTTDFHQNRQETGLNDTLVFRQFAVPAQSALLCAYPESAASGRNSTDDRNPLPLGRSERTRRLLVLPNFAFVPQFDGLCRIRSIV